MQLSASGGILATRLLMVDPIGNPDDERSLFEAVLDSRAIAVRGSGDGSSEGDGHGANDDASASGTSAAAVPRPPPQRLARLPARLLEAAPLLESIELRACA